MAVFEIKTMLQSARKYPQQNPEPYRNQPINLLCKSIDWFPHNTSLYQRYLQADLNGTFQAIKKKSRKSLVRPESYSESPEKSQTAPLSKKPINLIDMTFLIAVEYKLQNYLTQLRRNRLIILGLNGIYIHQINPIQDGGHMGILPVSPLQLLQTQ